MVNRWLFPQMTIDCNIELFCCFVNRRQLNRINQEKLYNILCLCSTKIQGNLNEDVVTKGTFNGLIVAVFKMNQLVCLIRFMCKH